MSNGRQYGGWDALCSIFGPIGVRYERRAGHAEKSAGFTREGRQITVFADGLIEKAELLPWAKAEIEARTGIRWKLNPDGSESQLQNLESREVACLQPKKR